MSPGGVDFGTKKWVEKVEGNKVEKKWPKTPIPIIDLSNWEPLRGDTARPPVEVGRMGLASDGLER